VNLTTEDVIYQKKAEHNSKSQMNSMGKLSQNYQVGKQIRSHSLLFHYQASSSLDPIERMSEKYSIKNNSHLLLDNPAIKVMNQERLDHPGLQHPPHNHSPHPIEHVIFRWCTTSQQPQPSQRATPQPRIPNY
jgi:hypothetical protein